MLSVIFEIFSICSSQIPYASLKVFNVFKKRKPISERGLMRWLEKGLFENRLWRYVPVTYYGMHEVGDNGGFFLCMRNRNNLQVN